MTIFFVLLRAGLWGKKLDDTAFFPLSGESWETIYRIARRQTVAGLVYQGVCLLPDQLLPPEELLLRWVAHVHSIEQTNLRMNRAIADLYRLFRANGLNPLVQKGQGVASLYDEPLLRECGDIDFYFSTNAAAEAAASLMARQDVRIAREADGSIFYQWKGVDVEHHRQLVDINNPFKRRFLRKLENDCGSLSMRLAEGGTEMAVPSPLLNLLLVNAHILKHVLGRGVGLRQLCDMARAYYRLRGMVDGYEVRYIYNKVGIARWSSLLHSFLTEQLDLPADCLPYREGRVSPKPLLDSVFKGGNFGQYRSGSPVDETKGWLRKVRTVEAFVRNARFSLAYAPTEAFWTFADLAWGQIRK